MKAAQGHEVGELGVSAISPVLDVMGVEVALMGAAGKAAPPIAGVQGAADGGGDAAGFASHIQGFTVLVLEQMKQAGIAGEAAHGLGGKRGTVFELAAPGRLL